MVYMSSPFNVVVDQSICDCSQSFLVLQSSVRQKAEWLVIIKNPKGTFTLKSFRYNNMVLVKKKITLLNTGICSVCTNKHFLSIPVLSHTNQSVVNLICCQINAATKRHCIYATAQMANYLLPQKLCFFFTLGL